MPRNMKLRPLIINTLENVKHFQSDFEKTGDSKDPETELDGCYQSFVDNLHRNMEDFEEYRNQQINGVTQEEVGNEILESIIESIFDIEKPGNIDERSERVRQIQNSLFWDTIKGFVDQLESLEDEVSELKVDSVDTDSSSRRNP